MRTRTTFRSRTAGSDDLSELVQALNSSKILEDDVLLPDIEDELEDEEVNVVLCFIDNGGGLSMADEVFLYADTTVESALESAMTYVT